MRKKKWDKKIWNDISLKLKELGFSSVEIHDIYIDCKREIDSNSKS